MSEILTNGDSRDATLVLDFAAAWRARDIDGVMGFFADNCFYHNIPMEPILGAAKIRAFTAPFLRGADEIEMVIHNIADNGNGTVLAERNDRFRFGEVWVDLPVTGAFDIAAGKITAWRDYFDLEQFKRQMKGIELPK